MLKGLVGSLCLLPTKSFGGLALEMKGKSDLSTEHTEKSSDEGAIEFASSDSDLVKGFHWAKIEALSYVRNNGTIGPWYYAALPGRNAFCMRDTSHMATGAQLLGLGNRNHVMLREFAANISQAQRWCSWWEITGDGKPAKEDYKSVTDFWYDLPANFDVLDACYRQWLWSRDQSYVSDTVFLDFYHQSVTSYVREWENHRNGMLGGIPSPLYMGIPTYDESISAVIGADLIAAQFAAYRDYANILRYKRQSAQAIQFDKKASELRRLYNEKWWDPATKSFYSYIGGEGKFWTLDTVTLENQFPLYFGLAETGIKADSLIERLEQGLRNVQSSLFTGAGGPVESISYLPNIFYKYGRTEEAYRVLLILTDPNLKRRSYPEVSFTVVGNIGSGLMGIHPLISKRTIQTLPQLPEHAGGDTWAELRNVPVGENVISVMHRGNKETRLTNQSGPDLLWRASFMGNAEKIFVDNKPVVPKMSTTEEGIQEVWIDIAVKHGQTREAHC